MDIAVDVMFSSERLGQVLHDFAETFPTVQLRLHVEALGAITGLVRDGAAIVGVSGPLALGVEGIDSLAAGSTLMVPVAAPDHPLAQMGAIAPGYARDHVQLVLSDRSRLTEGRDFGVISRKTWRLADLSAKHALLREGVGWGSMPLPMVAADLESGVLVRLNLPDHSGGRYGLSAIWRTDTPPAPAASWLRDQFVELGRNDDVARVGL